MQVSKAAKVKTKLMLYLEARAQSELSISTDVLKLLRNTTKKSTVGNRKSLQTQLWAHKLTGNNWNSCISLWRNQFIRQPWQLITFSIALISKDGRFSIPSSAQTHNLALVEHVLASLGSKRVVTEWARLYVQCSTAAPRLDSSAELLKHLLA